MAPNVESGLCSRLSTVRVESGVFHAMGSA
jgi:hypothetical protein